MITTIVYIKVKPDKIQEFIDACRENHEASVKEAGNLRFDVLQDDADPGRFVLYEAYADKESQAAHKQTSHYAAWRDTVTDMMAEPRKGIPYTALYPLA
jgi:autoinducer 2-degrading protein